MKWDRLEKLESQAHDHRTDQRACARHQLAQGAGAARHHAGGWRQQRLARRWHGSLSRPGKGRRRVHSRPRRPRRAPMPIGIVAPGAASAARRRRFNGAGSRARRDRSPGEPADTLDVLSSDEHRSALIHGPLGAWHPAAPSGGGGAVQPRGGSGGPSAAPVAACESRQIQRRVSSGASPSASAGSSSAGSRRPCFGPRPGRRRIGGGGRGSAPRRAPCGDHRQPQRPGHGTERRRTAASHASPVDAIPTPAQLLS